MRAIAIGIPFIRRSGIDAQAQAHYNRVIADGGLVPSGLSGVNAFFNTIKTIYGTSDINTAISVGLDPQVLGYKLGAGSGTTLGQAAQKLYSPKDVFGGIGTGNAYWEGSGVTGNFIQSNTSAYNTNDIDIEVQASTVATTGDVSFVNISNGTSTTVDFFYSKTNGVIQFQYYTGGFRNSFAVATIADGDIFRVTRNATTGSIVFRKNGIILTTSGAQVAGVLDFVNTTIKIGQGVCKINYANFYIAGVLNKTFNPNQYTGANTWTSTTSEVWTVNRTGAGLADVVQTTAASQPLLLVHEGANYWFGSGVNGNFCSTPNSVANSNNGNKEIIVKFSTNDTTSFSDIVSKDEVGSNRAYAILYDHSNQRFSLVLTTDLQSTTVVNTDSGTILRNYSGWYKVTMTFSGGVLSIRTFESLDNITYTQVGSTITRNGNNFIGTDAILNIGSRSTTSGSCIAKIDRVTISNSIGGTPVVDFNPNQYNAATSQTQWTSSTGEVWTINTGTATTGYKGVLVDRTIVQGDGIDDGLVTSATINMPTVLTIYGAIKGYNNEEGSGKSLFGKSNIDGNVFRKSATELGGWIGNAGLAYYGVLANVTNLNLVTFKRKVSDNVLQANNGSIVNNTNSSAIVNSTISMFSVTTFGSSNGIVNTGVISFIEDNSTQKTAMYNYIKSINNNAF
jgi:hypothetical protein